MPERLASGFPSFALGIVALPTESVPLHIFEDRYRTQVLDRTDDGRSNILARGTRPFRLLERQHNLPYPAGVVEFLEETDEEMIERAQMRALSNGKVRFG